jgi:hypothetical protein
LAIGANQTTRKDHERIYKVHLDFLNDLVHIPFLVNAIDTPSTEYLEAGITLVQTPRKWAKSLTSDSGEPLELDLENGTADGSAVLPVPSASLAPATAALHLYSSRQNPTLSYAERMYSDSISTHPDIPKTVFTKNIDTLLAKKFNLFASPGEDDASTEVTPASTLTGSTAIGGEKPR